ncbi:MAG TPA: FAD-binding protein [Acidimicrobiales bacterium]|nr:FAD-binding protein [Acidimicrobiales bacterium]
MRVAVLIKQVPRFEDMALGPDGRLQREGLELEMNPYCRRAVSKGAELAQASGGTCTVLTLGPPAAEDSLREAIAWGADTGVLITDPAFAGSDTLATARALAAAIDREGPFDLVLAGRNSVDADTGQVGPEVAELLDLPFLAGVRELEIDGDKVRARCEYDDGWLEAETSLPAVLSCAERLCEPAKVDPEGRAAVPADRLRRLTAADLGDGPWGQAGSPTRVGQIRVLEAQRQRLVLSGSLEEQARQAVALLRDRGALGYGPAAPAHEAALDPVPSSADAVSATSAAAVGGPVIVVLLEPDRLRVARELLGAAAHRASTVGGRVIAMGAPDGLPDPDVASSWGADAVVVLSGSGIEEDVARAVAGWCNDTQPWALLTAGTVWGREVASRLAARLGAGLTGDAVDLGTDNGRLVGWKPAFGGRLVAAITASSSIQLVTVRPGMLALFAPRPSGSLASTELVVESAGRVRHLDSARDDELDELMRAPAVVGVGTGVDPDEYPSLEPLLTALGAQLAATRKVTDKGWQPRARQVGITGRSISPLLYVAIGLSGKFNHVVGIRGAGEVLAINSDPEALVFGSADIGIVADWHDVVPLLVAELSVR